jgi:hypothetical protein
MTMGADYIFASIAFATSSGASTTACIPCARMIVVFAPGASLVGRIEQTCAALIQTYPSGEGRGQTDD